MSDKRFRIAFSYAGEKRDFVAQVAGILAKRFGKDSILYDRYHQAEFSRSDLAFYLPDLYEKEADLVVAVFCPDYEKKEWCGLEWNALYGLLKKRNVDEVMLTRFEHVEGKGLHGLAGYIDLDELTPEQTADLILERLALNEDLPKEQYLTSTSVTKGPVRDLVYISYSHNDKPWQQKLRRILDADPEIRDLVWDDEKIPPSVPFEKDIANHVKRARVMVMLVSEDYFRPNSLAAPLETQPALDAHSRGEMDILWVPVKAHNYRKSPVGHIMAATGAGATPLEHLPASGQKKALQIVWQEARRCLGLPKTTSRTKRIAGPSNSAASTKSLRNVGATSAKPTGAIKKWQEKLDFLQEELAVATTPAQKFEIKSQIEEAKEKIAELGG